MRCTAERFGSQKADHDPTDLAARALGRLRGEAVNRAPGTSRSRRAAMKFSKPSRGAVFAQSHWHLGWLQSQSGDNPFQDTKTPVPCPHWHHPKYKALNRQPAHAVLVCLPCADKVLMARNTKPHSVWHRRTFQATHLMMCLSCSSPGKWSFKKELKKTTNSAFALV